jgi:hypothetical protein
MAKQRWHKRNKRPEAFSSKEEMYEWLYRWRPCLVFYSAEERAEYKRAYNYVYNKRPEVKARKKAYMAVWRSSPEGKVYEKAYRAAYRATPQFRERDNALRKLRHLRAKRDYHSPPRKTHRRPQGTLIPKKSPHGQ